MNERLTSVVTSKGQTTIPKKVRDSLQLSQGDSIVFEVRESEVVFRKLPTLDPRWGRAVEATLSEWDDDLDDEL
ncbi:MAG: type II toxin-antitoxin system PrlF family antitoxin [Spirochaetales bacterium]|nr:type II toxin-antitoxin system PrlF family antitoxin [Spirochaetales bacterium]